MNGLRPPLHIISSSVSYDAAQTPMNSVQKPERKGEIAHPLQKQYQKSVLGEEQNILFKEEMYNERTFN